MDRKEYNVDTLLIPWGHSCTEMWSLDWIGFCLYFPSDWRLFIRFIRALLQCQTFKCLHVNRPDQSERVLLHQWVSGVCVWQVFYVWWCSSLPSLVWEVKRFKISNIYLHQIFSGTCQKVPCFTEFINAQCSIILTHLISIGQSIFAEEKITTGNPTSQLFVSTVPMPGDHVANIDDKWLTENEKVFYSVQ